MLLLLPRGWRERLLFRVPTIVTAYPYEALLAVACLVSGGPLAAQVAPKPGSINEVLPGWVGTIWGVSLLIAGLTLCLGLRGHGNLMLLAAGQRLLSTAGLVYWFAVVATAGPRGLVAGAMLAVVCLLSAFRAFYLRTSVEVFRRIQEVAKLTADQAEGEGA